MKPPISHSVEMENSASKNVEVVARIFEHRTMALKQFFPDPNIDEQDGAIRESYSEYHQDNPTGLQRGPIICELSSSCCPPTYQTPFSALDFIVYIKSHDPSSWRNLKRQVNDCPSYKGAIGLMYIIGINLSTSPCPNRYFEMWLNSESVEVHLLWGTCLCGGPNS